MKKYFRGFEIVIFIILGIILYLQGVHDGEERIKKQIDNIGVQNFITDTIPEISTWR